jgi:hypothetical protein
VPKRDSETKRPRIPPTASRLRETEVPRRRRPNKQQDLAQIPRGAATKTTAEVLVLGVVALLLVPLLFELFF